MNELNNFFLGVQQVAQDAVDKAPYDRTFRGVIEEINGDGTCNVRINGRTYNNVPCNDWLEVDEVVDVLFPQNNPSLMKIVNVPFDYSKTWNDDLNVNGDIYIQGVKMVDYIIDQGTSDIWTYRKWNSGVAECWGNVSKQITLSQAGNLYNNGTSHLYPSGLFVEIPVVTSTIIGNSDTRIWIGSNSSYSTYQTKDQWYALIISNVAMTNATFIASVHAIGRWK